MSRTTPIERLSRGPLFVAGLLLCLTVLAPAREAERIDLDAIGRMKVEAFQRSQVMETLRFISEIHGPRLTGSPYRQPVADYIQKRLTDWGLAKVRTEAFPVGRGWAAERLSAHVVSGQPWTLTGYAKAWTPGTSGMVRAEAALAVLEKESDFEPLRGKLKGKFALIVPKRDPRVLFDPVAWRHSAEDLAEFAKPPDPTIPVAFGRAVLNAQAGFREKLMAFLVGEGVACAFDTADRGLVGATQVMSGGPAEPNAPPVPCQVTLAAHHYNRLFRMLEQQVTPMIEMTVQNRFVDEGRAFNIIAELPGTDKADELVLMGAHWDSWHAGTGALDDGAGVATGMEAMRILKATHLPLRRTVRLILFDGEESGLLGSQAYVRAHVADPDTMTLKSEHGRISLYLNPDQGGGRMRGFGLNGNEPIAPVFAQWMKPFHNVGMGTLSQRMTGGGDHVPFDAVGIPAFEFHQDSVEYRRTLHTDQDRYDRIPAGDVMQNAVILAAFAFHAANREALMPRKPLPSVQQARDRWGLY